MHIKSEFINDYLNSIVWLQTTPAFYVSLRHMLFFLLLIFDLLILVADKGIVRRGRVDADDFRFIPDRNSTSRRCGVNCQMLSKDFLNVQMFRWAPEVTVISEVCITCKAMRDLHQVYRRNTINCLLCNTCKATCMVLLCNTCKATCMVFVMLSTYIKGTKLACLFVSYHHVLYYEIYLF